LLGANSISRFDVLVCIDIVGAITASGPTPGDYAAFLAANFSTRKEE
jgi:hypothetical protein